MKAPDATDVWVFEGVSKSYGDKTVLAGLTIEIVRGEVVALMGVNGAGKTTAARILLGLERPDAGTVTRPAGARSAAVFQENRLCGHLSAVDNVRLVLDRSRWGAIPTELEAAGLARESHAKPVTELSGGQQRRTALARALMPHAELVVLDEPFTGVDGETKAALIDFVRGRIGDSAVLLITHDVAEAEALGARVVRLSGEPGIGV